VLDKLNVRWVGVIVEAATIVAAGSWALAQETPQRAEVAYHLNCIAYPSGDYELARSYETQRQTKVDNGGSTKSGQTANYLFDMKYQAPHNGQVGSGRIEAVLRQLRVTIVTPDGFMSYDSNGKPADQTPILTGQFKHIVGLASTAEVAVASIRPFTGLDAGWDRFAQEQRGTPAQVVAMNKRNYGDVMLNRIFAAGAEIIATVPMYNLSGPGAPPLPDFITMTVGDEWKFTCNRDGIGGKPIDVEHTARVMAIRDGLVTVNVSWKINGMQPQPKADGTMVMSGADVQGGIDYTIHAASGLATDVLTTIKRVDQIALGAGDNIAQQTCTITETDHVWLKAKAAAVVGQPATPATKADQSNCPSCGTKVPVGAKFCPDCGAKIPASPAPSVARPTVCPKCGAKLAAEAKFCMECGWKVELVSAESEQPLGLQQVTPKQIVETDILAANRLDYDASVRITAPAFKDAAKLLGTVLEKVTQLHDRFESLAEAMEKPLGKEAAESVRMQAKQLSPENFKKSVASDIVTVCQNGKIDWNKITIEENGASATANWPGRDQPLKMVRLDGKWYSIPDEDMGKTPEEAKCNIQRMADAFDKGIAKLDDVIARLHGGSMTQQEFRVVMQDFAKVMQAMK